MSNRADVAIAESIAALRAAAATGIEQYEQKLRNNADEPEVLADLLLESRAALMFLRHGFEVAMQESPDLRIELDEEVVCVEVKHFREKEQDRLDEGAMRETPERLVRTGDLAQSEGAEAWEQIVAVAVKKAPQYASDAPNMLVVESSSPSLELMLRTAVNDYDKKVMKSADVRLRRLSGIMLAQTDWIVLRDMRNVCFLPTAHAAVPLSARMTHALFEIATDMLRREERECG
jgi:hypothetical protein